MHYVFINMLSMSSRCIIDLMSMLLSILFHILVNRLYHIGKYDIYISYNAENFSNPRL